MDKQFLVQRQEQVSAEFDNTTRQVNEAEKRLKELTEEQYRFQGEYRLLDELINNKEADEAAQPQEAEVVEGEV